ncbi:MAG: NAD(P)-binding protein [Bacteriovoracaceae bacterium]|nr:NAD(P)-binding protein [Bacteriovoracaceae bacterium]
MFYHCDTKVEKKYDVIVIGSGLAGMTAANKLARDGRSVLLLEAHAKLGGYATWFHRQDHVFDVSLHGFPFGMKKTCKKYWSREIADSIVPLDEVRFINPQFELSTKYDKVDFIKILNEKFGVTLETAQSFFDELEGMNFFDDRAILNRDLFEKYFPGRNDIVRLLMEPIVYANGSTLEDEAITYGIVFSNFMSKGVYVYKGGTDQMIKKMQKIMLDNSVDILVRALVDKVIVENGVVKGVIVDGHPIYSDAVLSNGNIKTTVLDMVGENHLSEDFKKKTEGVRLNTSSCQVYMGIRKGEKIDFMGDLIFYSDSEKFSSDELLSPEIHSQTFSVYYPDMRPHRGDRYTIVSSSNARFEDWENLTEDAYLDKKKFLEKRALDVIEKLVPGITEKIDFIESATPTTFKRYAHHQKGSSFGTKFEGLDVSMNLHKEVKGLFHAGSVGIIMSGWLGTANYGIIQSHEISNYLDK